MRVSNLVNLALPVSAMVAILMPWDHRGTSGLFNVGSWLAIVALCWLVGMEFMPSPAPRQPRPLLALFILVVVAADLVKFALAIEGRGFVWHAGWGLYAFVILIIVLSIREFWKHDWHAHFESSDPKKSKKKLHFFGLHVLLASCFLPWGKFRFFGTQTNFGLYDFIFAGGPIITLLVLGAVWNEWAESTLGPRRPWKLGLLICSLLGAMLAAAIVEAPGLGMIPFWIAGLLSLITASWNIHPRPAIEANP